MHHRLITLACLTALVLAFTHGMSAAREPELKHVMKAKLASFQAIIEGLALEDFDRIKRSAQTLSALSGGDAWKIHKTPEYIKFSRDFQDLADAMVKDAAARKLEAVTLDYVQMTMLCVKCHSHTRNQGVALLEKGHAAPFAAIAR
jgi:hypothetical protein